MFNQFTGIGNLAADPEVKTVKEDMQVATFTVCCDSGYGDKKKTEFVKCVAWGKLAELLGKYYHKGNKCLVQGSMQTRQWADKDGNKRYTTEIVANQVQNLSPKSDGAKSEQQIDREYRGSGGDTGDCPF
jgi:single-strand DNA-binding protein